MIVIGGYGFHTLIALKGKPLSRWVGKFSISTSYKKNMHQTLYPHDESGDGSGVEIPQSRKHAATKNLLKSSIEILLAFAISWPILAYAEDDQATQVGRYSITDAKPTTEQANILYTRVTVTFPPSVTDVSEAIDYLLRPYGYLVSSPQRRGPPTSDSSFASFTESTSRTRSAHTQRCTGNTRRSFVAIG